MDGCLLGRAVHLFAVRAQPPVRDVVVDRVIEEHHVLWHLHSMHSMYSFCMTLNLKGHRNPVFHLPIAESGRCAKWIYTGPWKPADSLQACTGQGSADLTLPERIALTKRLQAHHSLAQIHSG